MKKILLILLCTFGFVNIYNAECTNSELKNLNALSTYVESSFEFNESTGKFEVIFTNVPDELYIKSNLTIYNPNNGIVRISDVNQGSTIQYEVYSSVNAECITQYLRVITITTPYLNNFYGTSSCVDYENLDECNNKFLNYDLTETILKKRIDEEITRREKKEQNSSNKPNNTEENKDNTNIFSKIFDYVKEFYIPVLLVTISSLITFTICNIIYRKIKHGI